MGRVVFTDGMGSEHVNPTDQWLRDRVFNGDDAFWEGSSGDALLLFEESDGPKASINIVGRNRYGFKLSHGLTHEHDTYMLVHGNKGAEVATVFVGGNPIKFWRYSFVPKELAWEAIEYFLRTGDRKNGLSWEREDAPEQDA